MDDEARARELADKMVLDVCELPDRTSPEDWPEAMLVTSEELHAMVMDRVLAFAAEARRDALGEAAQVADRQLEIIDVSQSLAAVVTDAIRALIPSAERGADATVALAECRYILRYADQDMPDENFSGSGGRDAARERFRRQRSAWSVTLFQEIDRG